MSPLLAVAIGVPEAARVIIGVLGLLKFIKVWWSGLNSNISSLSFNLSNPVSFNSLSLTPA